MDSDGSQFVYFIFKFLLLGSLLIAARDRELEFQADAHAKKICGAAPMISSLEKMDEIENLAIYMGTTEEIIRNKYLRPIAILKNSPSLCNKDYFTLWMYRWMYPIGFSIEVFLIYCRFSFIISVGVPFAAAFWLLNSTRYKLLEYKLSRLLTLKSLERTIEAAVKNSQMLKDWIKKEGMRSKNGFFDWLIDDAYRTHPPTEDRIEALRLLSI
jgi:Zn-dependent protease with chaperone function